MQAYRIMATVKPDHTLLLTAPIDVEPGPVEVLILASPPAPKGRKQALLKFLDELEKRPRKTRSKKDIDESLRKERDSWD
ncbi:MAG: hypothetical protein NTX50_31885 [Candidatus Sumerlaeota bacterium]|nr:hypothetical protein [Candidatus Sumerlaeota bacterium]